MNPERGFAMPMAIFMLVVLSLLAALLMRLTASTLAADALELEGERAYQTAQSGLEAGIYYVTHNSGCPSSPGLNVQLGGMLANFTATVSCQALSANEGGKSVNYYVITSSACNQPNANGNCPNAAPTLMEYSARSVTAQIER